VASRQLHAVRQKLRCDCIPRVVWASSVAVLRNSGVPQIDISALEAAARAYELCTPELYLGGVLADEMDRRWATRVR